MLIMNESTFLNSLFTNDWNSLYTRFTIKSDVYQQFVNQESFQEGPFYMQITHIFTKFSWMRRNNHLENIYTTIPETAGHNLWRSPFRPVDCQPKSFLQRWINSHSSSFQEGKFQGHYTWKETHGDLNDTAPESYYKPVLSVQSLGNESLFVTFAPGCAPYPHGLISTPRGQVTPQFCSLCRPIASIYGKSQGHVTYYFVQFIFIQIIFNSRTP